MPHRFVVPRSLLLELARIKVSSFNEEFSVPRGAFGKGIDAEAVQVKRQIKQKVSFHRELTSDGPAAYPAKPTGKPARVARSVDVGRRFLQFERPVYCR